MSTKSTWDRRFPEFDHFTSDEIDEWVEDASGYVRAELYGHNYTKALLAAAAHLAKLADMSGDPNHAGHSKVVSERTGPQSVKYDSSGGSSDPSDEWWEKTQYGQQVVSLRQQEQPPAGTMVL